MSRSSWKGPNLTSSFLKIKGQAKKGLTFRAGVVLPAFINKTFRVHNGRAFFSLKVTNPIIGFVFGEFSMTRRKYKYKKS